MKKIEKISEPLPAIALDDSDIRFISKRIPAISAGKEAAADVDAYLASIMNRTGNAGRKFSVDLRNRTIVVQPN